MKIESFKRDTSPEANIKECYDCGSRIYDTDTIKITFTEEKPIYLDTECAKELLEGLVGVLENDD